MDGLSQWQEQLLQRHRLEPAYLASAQYWFDPLADSLVTFREAANRPILVALNGSQGSGKSTLCAYLQMAIAAKYDRRVVTLSLDDFYFTRDQRLKLSQAIHPLLATRGVPGTHNMKLLNRTLDQLLAMQSSDDIEIPRFDKAKDNPRPIPEKVAGPIDIVLLEGWCLGVGPQPIEELVEPVNTLEKLEDPDGVWRNYVNSKLATDFLPLYERVDQWAMLQAPSFQGVFQWRLEQEQKLARSRSADGGPGLMNEEQLTRFVRFFQRLTQASLKQVSDRVHHLYVLDANRKVISSRTRETLPV